MQFQFRVNFCIRPYHRSGLIENHGFVDPPSIGCHLPKHNLKKQSYSKHLGWILRKIFLLASLRPGFTVYVWHTSEKQPRWTTQAGESPPFGKEACWDIRTQA